MTNEKQVDQGISDIVGALTDPIISYPSPWNQDIPQWVKTRITVERLAMNIKALRGEEPTGTDAEVVAYLMPASLEGPLGRDWTEIYIYITAKVCAAHGMEVPEDLPAKSLTRDQERDLNRLKTWLYERRIKARLERDRVERLEKKEKEKERRKLEQPALFTF